MWNDLFDYFFVALLIPIVYQFVLAIASIKYPVPLQNHEPSSFHKFLVVIAAHDEETVIGRTVGLIRSSDYPSEKFQVCVVADHCSDQTANFARNAGAIVFERNEGPRSGKGAALSWLFDQIWKNFSDIEAIVIFDADTRVDRSFLSVMNLRLNEGLQVIQGQHIISNPNSGWYPLLTSALFFIDNRFNNLGRSNLGWSAKHMGDSICFKSNVLKKIGWGTGLTEDYHMRHQLLLAGIWIVYDPRAKGYGEAAPSWMGAARQRIRWLRGTQDASRNFIKELLIQALRKMEPAIIDGVLQIVLPSYSTTTLLIGAGFLIQVCINFLQPGVFSQVSLIAWSIGLLMLFLYPMLGLWLEKAPLRYYLVILTGPVFIIWRTWLALKSRISRKVDWVRTTRESEAGV
jgi:cellulose synthase/poly-beta-1,6-N-acetylglucosamine synthase-like glycosyltransferase